MSPLSRFGSESAAQPTASGGAAVDAGEAPVLDDARGGIAAEALITSGEWALARWLPLVLEWVSSCESYKPRTVDRLVRLIMALRGFLEANGVEDIRDIGSEVLSDWYWAPARDYRTGRLRSVSPKTAGFRRWTSSVLLSVLAELGAPIIPAAVIGKPIRRQRAESQTRLLDPDRLNRVKAHADAGLVSSRRSAMLALSLAGGSAPEVAIAAAADIDLDAGTVTFCGRNGLRVNRLEGWPLETIHRRLRLHPPRTPAEPLCVGDDLTPERAAHVVTVRLRSVLRDAGLGGEPGITPMSIRLTAARAILDSDGLEAAARFLGAVSLDRTAAALGYDWAGRHAG